MSESEWQHELTLNGWRDGSGVTVGIDADGDLGLIDESGHSIIIAARDMPRLRKWLTERLAGDEPSPPTAST